MRTWLARFEPAPFRSGGKPFGFAQESRMTFPWEGVFTVKKVFISIEILCWSL